MITDMISRLDRPILELAVVDAFEDMCFYEGEEIINILEGYLEAVYNNTNTEEQDSLFIEMSMPYIEHSITKYASGIYEGLKSGGPKDPVNSKDGGLVGADTVAVINKEARNQYLAKAGLKTPDPAKAALTEAEQIKIWENTIGQIIYPAVKEGISNAKSALVKTGKNLSNSVQSGLLAGRKKMEKFFSNKIQKSFRGKNN